MRLSKYFYKHGNKNKMNSWITLQHTGFHSLRGKKKKGGLQKKREKPQIHPAHSLAPGSQVGWGNGPWWAAAVGQRCLEDGSLFVDEKQSEPRVEEKWLSFKSPGLRIHEFKSYTWKWLSHCSIPSPTPSTGAIFDEACWLGQENWSNEQNVQGTEEMLETGIVQLVPGLTNTL